MKVKLCMHVIICICAEMVACMHLCMCDVFHYVYLWSSVEIVLFTISAVAQGHGELSPFFQQKDIR